MRPRRLECKQKRRPPDGRISGQLKAADPVDLAGTVAAAAVAATAATEGLKVLQVAAAAASSGADPLTQGGPSLRARQTNNYTRR